ncbi:MAG: SEC-C metal-binding domain-containing protein, partial [Acidimicrobiia bacterium]|nr:SEC-C metal-binding domain-containing protein [Acidimicrobiia bacterium]
NVLKYDEVMNEQRKVIYARREQVLAGADLRDEAHEYLADAVDSVIRHHCVSDVTDEWDLDGLATEVNNLWPSPTGAADLEDAATTDDLYDQLMTEATEYYAAREAEIGDDVMRQVERQVMLRILDQKWREHLYEMDYLKEGIHLRAMGQRDPLTEWQREGFEMFGAMMDSVAQDFVKYVMHLQVKTQEPVAAEPEVTGEATKADARGAVRAASVAVDAPAAARAALVDDAPRVVEASDTSKQTTVVKDEFERTPRNAPCPCGSGKKFKQCHGR